MRQDGSSPDALRFAKESNCSYRSIQTLRCFTELDANGKPQQKCQRIYKKFKECPGRPIEVYEQVEDNIDPSSVLGTDSNDSQSHVFANGGDSFFSKLDGMFSTPWTQQEPPSGGRNKSFRQKIGDYFTFEKEKKPFKNGNEWKQFEKDFTEV